MIVHIAIHVPDIAPDTAEAVRVTDTIETHLCPKLNTLMTRLDGDGTPGADWWIEVMDGETRYKPDEMDTAR